MAVNPINPGGNIENITRGVRSITGVPTSITAFIGRALRGPTDTPVLVTSFGEFERKFGGLWNASTMSFAVRDFFRNGGSKALIVRLYNPEAGGNAGVGTANLTYGTLRLKASSPGLWGNRLRIRVDHETRAPKPGEEGTLLNLYVRDGATGDTEIFSNVSIAEGHPRQLDEVLRAGSNLVEMILPLPEELPLAHPLPQGGGDVWDDHQPETNAKFMEQGSDGLDLDIHNFIGGQKQTDQTGLYALEKADLFNLLCIPPYLPSGDVDPALVSTAAVFCENHRTMLLIDPPSSWKDKGSAIAGISAGIGTKSKNACLYFPRLKQPNPLRDDEIEEFVPGGAVAGLIARMDEARGVWKAPAGLEAVLVNVPALTVDLTNAEIGELNQRGINCIRDLPASGRVVWGGRTLQGSSDLSSEWKYVNVRRFAIYLEESISRGTQWAVFEPNGEPLWSDIRRSVHTFLETLFKEGAFVGRSQREAFFVKCGRETITPDDIDKGIVNIVVGFAPLKPAEFVILKIQQKAGQTPDPDPEPNPDPDPSPANGVLSGLLKKICELLCSRFS